MSNIPEGVNADGPGRRVAPDPPRVGMPAPSDPCPSRPACPACGGPLFEQRAKLICAGAGRSARRAARAGPVETWLASEECADGPPGASGVEPPRGERSAGELAEEPPHPLEPGPRGGIGGQVARLVGVVGDVEQLLMDVALAADVGPLAVADGPERPSRLEDEPVGGRVERVVGNDLGECPALVPAGVGRGALVPGTAPASCRGRLRCPPGRRGPRWWRPGLAGWRSRSPAGRPVPGPRTPRAARSRAGRGARSRTGWYRGNRRRGARRSSRRGRPRR